MDFFQIKETIGKDGSITLSPDFIVGSSNDIMVRAKEFYAVWDEEKGLWFWFSVANGQNTSIHNLMLSAMKYNDENLDEKYELVSKEFDRLYTILMLTESYDSSGFVPLISELAMRIRNEDNLNSITREFLKTIKDTIKAKRNKESVEDIFAYGLYENAGYKLGNSFLRYFFGRIDHFLAEEMKLATVSYHGLIKQTSGSVVYHVEHILARNDENKSWFEDDDVFENKRDLLGSLTLLKGPDNQSSGSEEYKDKLITYMNVGTIWAKTLCENYKHSNKGLDAFCERYKIEFKSYERYDELAIRERFVLLMMLVRKIWGFNMEG